MARCLEHHMKLTDGVGKCSVPMWDNGSPAGFCDNLAYGKPEPYEVYFNYTANRAMRKDGKYDGYVPGLACVAHGGPEKLKE